MTVTEFIQTSVPFLTGLTDDQAHYLAQSAEQLVFQKGQTVLFRGVTVDGLHVIAQGKVSIHAKIGKEVQKVADLAAGDVFGETSIVEMTTAMATVKSEEDNTLLFVIPEEAFRKILATDPELQKRVIGVIEERKKRNAPPPKTA